MIYFKTAKKAQEKKNTLASNSDKAQDGVTETTEMELLSPVMTKDLATITANISEVNMKLSLTPSYKRIGDQPKELQNTRISAVQDKNTWKKLEKWPRCRSVAMTRRTEADAKNIVQ